MKYPPDRFNDRFDGHSDNDPELDTIVDFAHSIKDFSQLKIDSAFSNKLEREIIARASRKKKQKYQYFWIQVAVAVFIVCLFVITSLLFMQVSNPGSHVKHKVLPKATPTSVQSAPSIDTTQTPTNALNTKSWLTPTSTPNITPVATETSIVTPTSTAQPSPIGLPSSNEHKSVACINATCL